MTDKWGIDEGWWGVDGTWHDTPDRTRAALREAMGAGGDAGPPGHRPVWVVRPGATEDLLDPCTVTLEDGTDLGTVRSLPLDLPLGYHRLHPERGGPDTHLIVSPRRCRVPDELRAWGVAVQVPSARSTSSWGIGDLADVRALAQWVSGLGGGVLALSPLHAPSPVGTPDPSPYYPTSRRWRSPMLIRIDEVPGAAGDRRVEDLATSARALLDDRRIDRAAVWSLQREALSHLWRIQPDGGGRDFTAWRAAQGASLERYATYCALAERHGTGWSGWPAEHRHPSAPAVAESAGALVDKVGFHAWLQWLVEVQLEGAGAPGVRLVQDLAVGADPDGADAWAWQDLLALDARIGAPPDHFAPDGQDWGLPPFVPWRLRDAGYRPLAELIRGSLALGGGLRIDHVMGLSRLFWIPAGRPASEGAYVRYPTEELLAVVALESARLGALVVGEDLGTVEPELRNQLEEAGVLSTRLVWFEAGPPSTFPTHAMASVTTHDLPTVAGVWTGSDQAELERIGAAADRESVALMRDRLTQLAGATTGEPPVEDVIVRTHRALGRSPSVLAVAAMEDLLGVEERPNVPGTTAERPENWSLALPVAIDELGEHPLASRVVEALGETRARSGT
jgi:4-alpha-glucanotransferase